ncbi:helix-turn-helix transcriptional regulator [Streptomyces sp. WMMC897]|uniref:helix-turn-helix transcriptional regulator n=1 Tax=Streptomyces sp. WMMC897 TaxID=3014782 RepID=UPI0022B62A29|nr:LuxR C-terminal-related transcriptional regulator [Streptomyces sp. WMMC897]MCZ7414482.1 LuxR C-terminal-related transcriptional regulator [Streptomyces sp. WMMC897]
MIPHTVSTQPLRDAAEVTETARRLLGDEEGDVFCYWNGGALDDPVLDVLREPGLRLRRAAGRTRVVLPHAGLRLPDIAEPMARHVQDGVGVRHSPRLPPGALVLTAGGAVLTTGLGAGTQYVLTRDSAALRALSGLSDLLWERADRYHEEREEPPTESERQLLGMLVRGLTDHAIARQLGLSDRTVRRVVAQLMDRLRARSRFEAGARAAERGWI